MDKIFSARSRTALCLLAVMFAVFAYAAFINLQ